MSMVIGVREVFLSIIASVRIDVMNVLNPIEGEMLRRIRVVDKHFIRAYLRRVNRCRFYLLFSQQIFEKAAIVKERIVHLRKL